MVLFFPNDVCHIGTVIYDGKKTKRTVCECLAYFRRLCEVDGYMCI